MTESSAAEPVVPIFDDAELTRVLVVVAHPDDAEYGVSAAVAEWTSRGIEVGYLLATAGEAGMRRPPDEARTARLAEQQRACEIVGVEQLRCLDFPDGMVEYGVPLRAAIAHEIRKFRPDTVVTGSGDLRVPWGLDHADHRAVGLATIDATRDAGNQWLFTDQLVDGVQPWETSRLLLTGSTPTHVVEISAASVDKAVASLAAHVEYFADLPDHPAAHQFIPPMLETAGELAGVPFGMGFEVH